MSDFVERRIKRVTIAATVSTYLVAITWPISPFIAWLFVGTAVYFVFLRIYFLKMVAPKRTPLSANAKNFLFPGFNKKRAIFIVVMSAIGIALVLFKQLSEMGSIQELVSRDKINLEKGIQFYQAQQYDSALACYNAIDPTTEEFKGALYNKALIYYDQKEYPKAIALVNQCIKKYDDYGTAKQLLGDCYSVQEKQDSALFYYEIAYEQGERNAQLCHWLGYLFDSKQNVDQAKKYYKEAVGLDSSRVEIYERLANIDVTDSLHYLSLAKRWRAKQ